METPRPCYGDIPHYRSHVPEEQDAVGQTEHRCMGIPVQGFHKPSPHGTAIPSEHETGIALLPLTAATTLRGNDAIPPRRGDGPLQRGSPEAMLRHSSIPSLLRNTSITMSRCRALAFRLSIKATVRRTTDPFSRQSAGTMHQGGVKTSSRWSIGTWDRESTATSSRWSAEARDHAETGSVIRRNRGTLESSSVGTWDQRSVVLEIQRQNAIPQFRELGVRKNMGPVVQCFGKSRPTN